MKNVLGYIVLIIGAILVLPTLINAFGAQKRANMATQASLIPATLPAQQALAYQNYQQQSALLNQQIQADANAQNSAQNYQLISQGIGTGAGLLSQVFGSDDSGDSEN